MNDSDGSAYSEKLPFKTKLAYGAGDLGPAITANIAIFFSWFSLPMSLVSRRV